MIFQPTIGAVCACLIPLLAIQAGPAERYKAEEMNGGGEETFFPFESLGHITHTIRRTVAVLQNAPFVSENDFLVYR